MRTTYLLVLLIASICLNSCGKKQTAGIGIPSESAIYGLASPIQLEDSWTTVRLSDYFPNPVPVDSIRCENLLYRYHDSLFELELMANPKSQNHLFNLNIYSNQTYYSIPVFASTEKTVLFSSTLSMEKADSVFLTGSFNNWSDKQHPLQFKGGEWVGKISLKAGEYPYQLKWYRNGVSRQEADPDNLNRRDNGMGGVNSVLIVEGAEEHALARITSWSDSADHLKIKSDLPLKNLWFYWQNHLISWKAINETTFECVIPELAENFNRSFIRVFGSNDIGRTNQLLIPLKGKKRVHSAEELSREDWEAAVLYFPMVDRFANGNPANDAPLNQASVLPKADYKGGDLQGILDKINEGYFEDLGINTLWLSPITQNPTSAWGQFRNPDTRFSGYHGYWPVTSTTIDHRFGDSVVLAQLLDAAHARKMNVILDYVANHVHIEHYIYQKHPEWATSLYLPDGSLNTERWDDHRLTTWFDTFLPTLNLENEQVAEFMADSALYWLTHFSFDGFRHDATKHIPNNFWRTLNRDIKTKVGVPQNKRIYQIGETYGSHELISSYLGSGLLDGQFDFNMYDQLLPVLSGIEPDMNRLASALRASLSQYGDHHLMGNISGNQDKPRFVSYADGSLDPNLEWNELKRLGWKETIPLKDSMALRKLAMAHAWNCAIPGLPVIYYGDEIGIPGAGDPDNRRMMQFDDLNAQQKSLRNEISEIIQFRRTALPLIYGESRIISSNSNHICLERSYFNEKVLFILLWNGSVSLNLPNPDSYQLVGQIGQKVEINSDNRINIKSTQPLSYTFLHFKR